MEIGDEVFTVHPSILQLHQILAAAGHDTHDDPADIHALGFEQGIQIIDPVALVQQVIHQQHRAAEGFDGANLVDQRGIARILFHGEGPDILGIPLFHMEGLGDRVGYNRIGQNLAVGHAHVAAQPTDTGGYIQHMVVRLYLVQQSLIEHFGIKGQHQCAGEHGGQGLPQTGTALLHHSLDPGLVPVGLLDGKIDILNEHHGIPHIHIVQIFTMGDGDETHLFQRFQQRRTGSGHAAQAVGMLLGQTAGQQLIDQTAAGLRLIAALAEDFIHNQNTAGGMAADKGGRLNILHHFQQLRRRCRMTAGPAQQPVAPAVIQAHGGGLPPCRVVAHIRRHIGRGVGGIVELLRLQQPLELGCPEIEAVLIDIGLDYRIHQHGNIQIFIHIFADSGGGDRLVIGRQGQQHQLAADDVFQRLGIGIRFLPVEDHMVILCRGTGTVGLVGRGVADHITACRQIQLPAREQSLQQGQIGGDGNIDGNLIGEYIDIPQVCHGHGGDLPAAQLGQRPLAPGEFIDGQIDLEAQGPDLLHDPLMTGGEGVEGAGEEGRRQHRLHGELTQRHLALHHETVEMVQHGGPVEEGQLGLAVFRQQAQQLLFDPQEDLPPLFQRQPVGRQHIPAQGRQGSLMDGIFIMGDAGDQNAQSPVGHHGIVLHRIDDLAQGIGGGSGRALHTGADHILQEGQVFIKFLLRQHAQQLAKVRRDKTGHLIPAVFQFPQQIHHDLIALIHGQQTGDSQQAVTGMLPNRQLLTDGQEVGQMGGGMEGIPGV